MTIEQILKALKEDELQTMLDFHWNTMKKAKPNSSGKQTKPDAMRNWLLARAPKNREGERQGKQQQQPGSKNTTPYCQKNLWQEMSWI